MSLFSLKQVRLWGLAALFMLALPHSGGAKLPESAGLSNWNALLPHPLEENKFLAAAQNSIYVSSRDLKDDWQKWSALPSPGLKIQKLLYFPRVPEQIFVLADQGIYKTNLAGTGYETVYEKRKTRESITDFAVHPDDPRRFFAGTSEGLLESRDAGASWHLFTPVEKSPVCFVRFSGKQFFVARPNDLLGSENLSRFQKVFSIPDIDNEEEALETAEDTEEESSTDFCALHDFTENQKSLWLATSRGVFESRNAGNSWQDISQGLLTRDIRYLAHDPQNQKVFAAGLRQVYEISEKENRWKEIPVGSAGSSFRGLSAADSDLKIVTASGLITHPILPDQITAVNPQLSETDKTLFRELVRLEPTPVQVQRVVSRYHHTQNTKINRWQLESRLRALFPTVSFKKDFSFDNNIDIDRRGTNEPDQFIEGPADTSRGWDFGVAWDLGDFIFSTSQTSIDSREKLMMELRRDLTAEATRLFYERRRLQMETLLTPAASEQEHLDRLIRMEELTALLDALTNGFMSRQIELIYAEHPEFHQLWEYKPGQISPGALSATPNEAVPAARTPR